MAEQLDIAEFIDMGGESAAPAPCLSLPGVAQDQAPAPCLKFNKRGKINLDRAIANVRPGKADKAYYHWLRANFDTFDICWGSAANQASNLRVEQSLNAGRRHDLRLKEIALWQVAKFRRDGGKIYLKPARHQDQPATHAFRLDIDCHHGEPDGQAMLKWINQTFFAGQVYSEPSDNGFSGWGVFELPEMVKSDGTVFYEAKRRTNGRAAILQAALRLLCAAQGFKAQIEVKGTYNMPLEVDDGVRRMPIGSRGSMVKLPRCRQAEDVERLIEARFQVTVANQIIHAAWRLLRNSHTVDLAQPILRAAADLVLNLDEWKECNVSRLLDGVWQMPAPTKQSKPARQTKKSKAEPKPLLPSGDKLHDRCRSVSAAIRQEIGVRFDPAGVTDAQKEQIAQIGMGLYEAAGMATGERDADREAAFRRITEWMIKTHVDPDRAAQPRSGIWFTNDDLTKAENLLRSQLAKHELAKINRQNRKRMDGGRITYSALALALCTASKNIYTSQGDCPASAIAGMLNYFGFRCRAGMVAVIMDTLSRLGLISTDGRYTTGQARRWQVTGKAALRLPFLIEHKPAAEDRKMLEAQANRYGPAGCGGGLITAPLIYSSQSGMKAAPAFASSAPWPEVTYCEQGCEVGSVETDEMWPDEADFLGDTLSSARRESW